MLFLQRAYRRDLQSEKWDTFHRRYGSNRELHLPQASGRRGSRRRLSLGSDTNNSSLRNLDETFYSVVVGGRTPSKNGQPEQRRKLLQRKKKGNIKI